MADEPRVTHRKVVQIPILGVPVGFARILDESFLVESADTFIGDRIDHLRATTAIDELRAEAVKVAGVEEYLETAEDALVAAFCQQLDLLGHEEAEGLDGLEN